MFNSKSKHRLNATKSRKQSGQALAESAVSLVMFSIIFVLVAAFAVNTYYYMSYMSRMESVAAQAAKVFEGNKYFLGMIRQSFDATKASDNALSTAKSMASTIGLPEPSSVTFDDTNPDFVVCTMQVPLTVPFALSSFPPLLTLTAKGIAANSSDSTNPPAVFAIQAPSTESGHTGDMVGAMMPAYGTFVSHSLSSGYGPPMPFAPSTASMPTSAPGYIKPPCYYTGISINPGSGAPSLGESASLGSGEFINADGTKTVFHL